MSINVNLARRPGAAPAVTFPLVQGMGFVTGLYNTGYDTPILESGVLFKSIIQVVSKPKTNITKFRIVLVDGTIWLLYATSSNGQPITFKLVDQTKIQGTSNFKGFLQVAKFVDSNSESVYDAYVYPCPDVVNCN